MDLTLAAEHFAAAERHLAYAAEDRRTPDLANVHLGLATGHLRAAEYLRAAAPAADGPLLDRDGRTPAERVGAVDRSGPQASQGERDAAAALLADMLAAAAKHGITLDHFDWAADLPGACLDVIRRK